MNPDHDFFAGLVYNRAQCVGTSAQSKSSQTKQIAFRGKETCAGADRAIFTDVQGGDRAKRIWDW